VTKLIALAFRAAAVAIGIQPPDRQLGICRRMNKSDSYNARWSVAHVRSGFSNLNRMKPTPS